MEDYTEAAYEQQLEEKQRRTQQEFARFGVSKWRCFVLLKTLPNEAEFRVWHEDEDLYT